MNYRASRTTRIELNSDQTIASGQTITVFGILITNSTHQAAEVEFQTVDGNIKFLMNCPSCDSKEMNIQFIADGGLKVTGLNSADVEVAVFHSQGGS